MHHLLTTSLGMIVNHLNSIHVYKNANTQVPRESFQLSPNSVGGPHPIVKVLHGKLEGWAPREVGYGWSISQWKMKAKS